MPGVFSTSENQYLVQTRSGETRGGENKCAGLFLWFSGGHLEVKCSSPLLPRPSCCRPLLVCPKSTDSQAMEHTWWTWPRLRRFTLLSAHHHPYLLISKGWFQMSIWTWLRRSLVCLGVGELVYQMFFPNRFLTWVILRTLGLFWVFFCFCVLQLLIQLKNEDGKENANLWQI